MKIIRIFVVWGSSKLLDLGTQNFRLDFIDIQLRFQKLGLSIQTIGKFPIYRPNLGKVDNDVLRDNLFFGFHKGDNTEIHSFAFVLM